MKDIKYVDTRGREYDVVEHDHEFVCDWDEKRIRELELKIDYLYRKVEELMKKNE